MNALSNTLNGLKNRFSHLDRSAAHYRLAKFAYGDKLPDRKACPYWWVIVPSSLVVGGVKFLFLAILATTLAIGIFVMGIVAVPTAWFAGYNLVPKNAYPKCHPRNDKMFYPYKFSRKKPGAADDPWLSKRASRNVDKAPWQYAWRITLVSSVVLYFARRGFSDFGAATDYIDGRSSTILSIVIFGVVGVLTLALLGKIFASVVAPKLKEQYAKHCPEIAWTDASE